uniref:Uncharacterized protein n=1 Tax=Romanomermis culicivorax TaxID=13658 RepID=A0A915L075_ROMCU
MHRSQSRIIGLSDMDIQRLRLIYKSAPISCHIDYNFLFDFPDAVDAVGIGAKSNEFRTPCLKYKPRAAIFNPAKQGKLELQRSSDNVYSFGDLPSHTNPA